MSRNERAKFIRTNVGFIFQSFELLPYLTALENVALSLFIVYNVIPKAETSVKGTFYDEFSMKGAKVYLSYDFLSDKKLVFIDVKLKVKAGDINFIGRIIPLRLYKDGAYVPLMAELTLLAK